MVVCWGYDAGSLGLRFQTMDFPFFSFSEKHQLKILDHFEFPFKFSASFDIVTCFFNCLLVY